MAKPKQTITENASSSGERQSQAGFFSRVIAFVGETGHEMKRIRWPRRREVVNYTTAALLTCLIMGLLVWGFDVGVSKLMSLIGLV